MGGGPGQKLLRTHTDRAIREMQIQTTIYHFTVVGMVIITIVITTSVGEVVEKREHLRTADGNVN